jgi:hypothetical protein
MKDVKRIAEKVVMTYFNVLAKILAFACKNWRKPYKNLT